MQGDFVVSLPRLQVRIATISHVLSLAECSQEKVVAILKHMRTAWGRSLDLEDLGPSLTEGTAVLVDATGPTT